MSEDNPPVDHVVVDDETDGKIEDHVKSKSTWLRLLFMAIFYALASLASLVLTFVVALGFFWVLFTGEKNRRLQAVGQGIASYLYQIVRYLTYNSDEKPFPFEAEWPSPEGDN
ncbi:MAG: DUF4389 domain-containing protein [Woeseiaceae bacterium]